MSTWKNPAVCLLVSFFVLISAEKANAQQSANA